MRAPPLGVVTGAILPPEVFGGFGPVDAFTWRGACVGGCGARPGCREESPAPECSGCGRTRHGLTDVAPRVPWRPAVHALGAYRLLITASRTWDDVATLRAVLDGYADRYGARLVVVHGHCPDGGDAIADAWYVERYGREPERHPADWSLHGRAAGPIRNSAMVSTRPDECLAFLRDGSRGTADCAGKAERAGIPTTRYLYGQPTTNQLPVAASVAAATGPTVLRPATDVRPDDPALPAGVRRLVAVAPAGTRVTLAVAADADGVPVASLAVRMPGVGFAVYERRGEGGAWRFANAVAVAPRPRHRLPARAHLMRANVGRFTAALLGEEYDPTPTLDVAPPAPVPTGVCPGCDAEVRLTQAGAIYANHRCKSKTIEGRS